MWLQTKKAIGYQSSMLYWCFWRWRKDHKLWHEIDAILDAGKDKEMDFSLGPVEKNSTLILA